MSITSWHHIPRYVVASILTSVGGFLFGIDTGIIGPVTVLESFTQTFGSSSTAVHGLIVSSILIPAAISSLLAGRLADTLGRPPAIGIGSVIFAFGAALEAGSTHLAMFIVGRIIAGIGEGLYLGTLVVYICEISPPRYRGRLSSGPQLLNTLGLVIGFFTCYGTTEMQSSWSWRLPFIVLFAFSSAFAIASFAWLPPSPRWLMLKGRLEESTNAWECLNVHSADREKMVHIEDISGNDIACVILPGPSSGTRSKRDNAGRDSDDNTPEKSPSFRIISHLFAADSRVQFLLAVFLMGMQQLSGIDGVLYYAPLLFKQAGLSSDQSSFLASGVSAIVIFAVTLPAIICADKWSRRANTIFGGVGMAITMFLMGGLYIGDVVHPNDGAGRWVIIITIYVFTVLYCTTWGVGIKIYAAEIQPQRTRATATSIAHGSNWLCNFLVALITPTLLSNSNCGAYFLFGGCSLITAMICWMFMPETRGKKLDEIDESFKGDCFSAKAAVTRLKQLLRIK